MAELAEYQQWLRNGIKAGAAGDPNQKYLAHLAQYDENSPFYGGSMQFGNLQYRANGQSNGRDLGSALSSMSGAELQTLLRNKINARSTITTNYNDVGQAEEAPSQWAALNPRDLAEVEKIDPNKRYAYAADDAQDFGAQTITGGLGQYREAPADFDPGKYAGFEVVRPGELDNFVNNVKGMVGDQFDQAWQTQIEPSLRKSGAKGDLSAVRNKAKANFIDKQIPWQDMLKYDPNVGLMASYGTVKHVNDQGGGWDKYKKAWIQTAMAIAATAGVAAPVGAAAGAAAAGATGTAAAGTIAGGAVQGIVGSMIGSGLTGTKLSGKGMLTSALMGGLTPYANANLGQYITRPGTTALLETIRQAATNKGKVDPRLVLATTAGSEAAGFVGDHLSDGKGLVSKFLGGLAGGAVKQGINGGQIDAAGMALSGVGNTGTAGSMMARAAQTYRGQQAVRQFMAQRQKG